MSPKSTLKTSPKTSPKSTPKSYTEVAEFRRSTSPINKNLVNEDNEYTTALSNDTQELINKINEDTKESEKVLDKERNLCTMFDL